MKILCFTPAIIKLITGLVFGSDVSLQKVLDIIKENNQNMQPTNESDYDLFADAQLKDFADCLEECSVEQGETKNQQPDDNGDYSAEVIFELIRVIDQYYHQQFIDTVKLFTQVYDVNQFPAQNQQQESLKIESQQFLNFRQLEMLGFR